MSIKLHYAGQLGAEGFGWATCNNNLFNALYQHFKPVDHPIDADVVFMPLADHDLNPVTDARARWNVAFTFFEFPLGPNAAANAAKYDIVFCGSTWCKERLAEIGVHNTEVLIQGVDQSIFYPRPRKPDGQFRIFSGGKFEYRKGQDLVIAAFREFSRTHPDAHLVCSWFNPWGALVFEGLARAGIRVPATTNFTTFEEAWLEILPFNGIPSDRFTILPQLSHAELAEEMAQTDCGLFPNRCEGGTNLVLMEYAAMGKACVTNGLTGHADVIEDIARVHIGATTDENHWAVQSVDAVVAAMEIARKVFIPGNVEVSRCLVEDCFSWAKSAQTVANAIERLMVAV